MDHRIVIPPSLQKHVLYVLHSAHQSVSGMKARANATIYWSGMINNIFSTRYITVNIVMKLHQVNSGSP